MITDTQKINTLKLSPLLEENELLQVNYALLAKRSQLTPYPVKLSPLPSGAVPLFHRSFFPWGALPYPKQHAELGALLAQLEDQETDRILHHMAHYQEATLDHYQKPIYSLFLQEGGESYSSLEEANRVFFEAVALTPAPTLQFVDPTLCMLSKRSETATLLCVGSGCKSGMGVYLSHDAGIVNYAPQLHPLGECAGFGLAGRAQKTHLEAGERFSLSYRCRISAPSSRNTGFAHLQDAGYSGLWMEAEIGGDLNGISLKTHFEGFSPLNRLLFSFFGKGKECLVARSHKLNPRSLDRYQGPPQPLSLLGQQGGVRLDAMEGVSSMEIVPLAGDESFWGADFLIAYSLAEPTLTFALRTLE